MDSELLWFVFLFIVVEIFSVVNCYDLLFSVCIYVMNDGSFVNVYFIGILFNVVYFEEVKVVVDFLLLFWV